MQASDYPVTHPFGATYKPWTKQNPHTGEDRGHRITKLMPPGTPVNVGNTIIGLSGATGKVTGAHLHIQKYKNGYLNPAGRGLADTIAFPAVVSETGNKADTGMFVRIIDNEGVRWSYFHLSEIKVHKGQIITGAKKMDSAKLRQAVANFIQYTGNGFNKDYVPTPAQVDDWAKRVAADPNVWLDLSAALGKTKMHEEVFYRADNPEGGYPALKKQLEACGKKFKKIDQDVYVEEK